MLALPSRHVLLLLGATTLAAGCLPADLARHDRRYPDSRRAPSRTERVVAERVVRARIVRDVDRYVQHLDRALRLDRRQEQRIGDLLADRTYDRVRRTRVRDLERAYPFPRRAGDRFTRDWWRQTDRRIERTLDRRQRRAYRALVHDRYERGRRPGRGRG